MKLDPKTTQALKNLAGLLRRYVIVLSVALFAGLSAYLILQTQSSLTKEPSANELNSQLTATSRPKISPEAETVIKNLSEQNIHISSDIDQKRRNPFAE